MDLILNVAVAAINTVLFDFGNFGIFLLGKHLVSQIFTTKSHMWFCPT